jgi:hypothetical protein
VCKNKTIMSSYSDIFKVGEKENDVKLPSAVLKVLTNAMQVMLSAQTEFNAYKYYELSGDPSLLKSFRFNQSELDRALTLFGENIKAVVDRRKSIFRNKIEFRNLRNVMTAEITVPTVDGDSLEEANKSLEETLAFRNEIRDYLRTFATELTDIGLEPVEFDTTTTSICKNFPKHSFLGTIKEVSAPTREFSSELPESPNSASRLVNACGIKFGHLDFLRHCRNQYSISVDGATVAFPSTLNSCSIQNVLNDLLDSFAIPQLKKDTSTEKQAAAGQVQVVGKLLNLQRRPIDIPKIESGDEPVADFILSSQSIKAQGFDEVVSCGRAVVPDWVGAFIRSIFPLSVKMWPTDFVLPNSLEETKIVQSFFALLACAIRLQTSTTSESLSEAFHGANAILNILLDGVPKDDVVKLIKIIACSCASIMVFWFGFVFNETFRTQMERSVPVKSWENRVDLVFGLMFWKPIMGLVPHIEEGTPAVETRRGKARNDSTIAALNPAEFKEARETLKKIQKELHDETDVVSVYFTVSTFMKEVTTRTARLSRLNQVLELDETESRACLSRPPQLLAFVAASIESRPSKLITQFCYQGVLRHYKEQEIKKGDGKLKEEKLKEIFSQSNEIVSRVANIRKQGVERQLLHIIDRPDWKDKAWDGIKQLGNSLMARASPTAATTAVAGTYGVGSIVVGGFHYFTKTTELMSVGPSVVAIYTTSMVTVGLASLAAAIFIGAGGAAALLRGLATLIRKITNADALRVKSGFPDFVTEVCVSEVEKGAIERVKSQIADYLTDSFTVDPHSLITSAVQSAAGAAATGLNSAYTNVVSNPIKKIVSTSTSALKSLFQSPTETLEGGETVPEFKTTPDANPYPIIISVGDIEVQAVGNKDRGVTQVASYLSSFDLVHCSWQETLADFIKANSQKPTLFDHEEFPKSLIIDLRNIMTLCFFKSIVPVELPHASALLHVLVSEALHPAINLSSKLLGVSHRRGAEHLAAQMLSDAASNTAKFKRIGAVVPITVTPNSGVQFVFGIPICRPSKIGIRDLQKLTSERFDDLRQVIIENPELHLTNILNFAICAMKNASANPTFELDSQRYAAVVLATLEDELPELRGYITSYINSNISSECVECSVKTTNKQIGLTRVRHRELSMLDGTCKAAEVGIVETKEREDDANDAIDKAQSKQAVKEVIQGLSSTCGLPLSDGAMLHIRRRFQISALSDTSPIGVMQGMVHTLGRFEWTSLFQTFQTEFIQRHMFKTTDYVLDAIDGKNVDDQIKFIDEITGTVPFGDVRIRALVLHTFVNYIDKTARCEASCGNLLTPFIKLQ